MSSAQHACERFTPQELFTHLRVAELLHRLRLFYPQRAVDHRQLFSAHPVGQKAKIPHHPEDLLRDVLFQARHNFMLRQRLCGHLTGIVVVLAEAQLKRMLSEDEVGQRLLTIPCVGTLTASTISTEPGDGKHYASSHEFTAATGRVPRQYITGSRTTLLDISKRGNKKSRTLLVRCARVFIQKLEHQKGKLADWARELLFRKSQFFVTCALAN